MFQFRGKMNIFLAIMFFAGMLLATADLAHAWLNWVDGCEACHGDFQATPYMSPLGDMWPGSLHTTHQNMVTDCFVCHNTSFDIPPLNQSQRTAADTTPGYGCSGCHGRTYGTTPESRGLREFHRNSGFHACSGCHPSPEATEPENIDPPNYGQILAVVEDSCNKAPDYFEDFSGNLKGLDNDGDTLHDESDPDCIPPTLTPTVTNTFPFSPRPTETPTVTNTPTNTFTAPTPRPTSTGSPTGTWATPWPTFTPPPSPTDTFPVTNTPTSDTTPVPEGNKGYTGLLFLAFGAMILLVIWRSRTV